MKVEYKLDAGSYEPVRAHQDDAGLDLRTPEDKRIEPNGNVAIDTGVHINIPKGYCGLLVPRSSLNVNYDMICTGLIDAGYTGSIVAKIHNLRPSAYEFKKGDKITQLVILPIPDIELEKVEKFEETERGSNGFGSSGQ